MKEFEMTDAQYKTLLEFCQPVPAIMLQCGPISTPQENANMAWRALGDELGFQWDTVEPVPGKGPKFFRAKEIPCEGIELGDGNTSGCDQSAGDCPVCES